MTVPHPIQRRYLAEQLVRLRRADEQQRYASAQRQGRVDPNPHQIDAVIFALKRIPEGGCILADEVGLGKTIEAGLILAQLRSEGAASRVLLVVPKPLLGQWQDELYRLFDIQALEGRFEPGGFSDTGVFLVGREVAGSDRGSQFLRECEPFDLCIIDEAHEVFANIYRRFDKNGNYRPDSTEARIADRVRSFLRKSPVLLLTATPIQNNLTELWGLIQYVEPTGTLLGNLRTFRDVFCDGDDRTLVAGQDDELRRRIETVVQRTLRRQAQDFLERPFVARHAQIFEYSMTAKEKSLYDQVTAYLLEPQLFAFRGSQRRLLLIGFHRLMGSSIAALTASLWKVARRLEQMLKGDSPGGANEILDDLDDDEEPQLEPATLDTDTAEAKLVEKELARVRSFLALAESLRRDSKAEKLLDVIRVLDERSSGRKQAVIFTESLVTQAYLEELLVQKGALSPEDITLFRGTNDSERAMQALKRWQAEIGDFLPPHQRPSRSVAIRLALVHEFRTRSRIFISTEAGAKGLNLQFCDTIVNYDLPWNPQRIEQRIGRCHRYGQEHDVTVINFLAADNEAQRLTFDILSRKLDLFGKVLDASDAVLHEPTTETPEILAGAVGSDFEGRLRRIYERARTVGEIEAELRDLRQQMENERTRFEETWARTAGLIETRFDKRVRQVFHRLQADLPQGLAQLDDEIDRLITGFLLSTGVQYRRVIGENIRFEISPSKRLPADWQDGGTASIGESRYSLDAESLHLGHPLVQAAVAEARDATGTVLQVGWVLDHGAPSELIARKGYPGRLVLVKVRYDGFESVDRLIPMAVLEGELSPLTMQSAQWLLDHAPDGSAEFRSPSFEKDLIDDLLEEQVFVDQIEVASEEQRAFERRLEQVESYVEDQLLVLHRRLTATKKSLRAAEERREVALGAEIRTQAEMQVRTIQEEIDSIEGDVVRLQSRDDEEYQRWRSHVQERRDRQPRITRILDVEFILE